MAKSNVPAEIHAAILKANGVDRSQKAHHVSLVAMMRAAVMLADDDALAFVSLYTSDRAEKSADSLCTLATNKWLELHFGIHVKDGVASKGRTWTGKGITEATVIAGKAYPWYVHVKDLAFKMPTGINLKAAAVIAARLEVTGEAVPTKDDLWSAWQLELAAARKSASLVAWTATYQAKVESGEIKIADAA